MEVADWRYLYGVRSWRVIDGDTVAAALDLGFGLSFETKARLYGINAPEVRGAEREAGLASAIRLGEILGHVPPDALLVETVKDRTGKYGRYLVRLLVDRGAGQLDDLNAQLVAEGHAKPAEY